MSNPGRPLSPHLSIYRWPITMTLSILHRISGMALSAGLIAFALWLFAASNGAMDYETFVTFFRSWFGQVMLIAWTTAFFLHFANGIRHLVWDLGYGFEVRQANASAWFVLAVTLVLTLAFWLLA